MHPDDTPMKRGEMPDDEMRGELQTRLESALKQREHHRIEADRWDRVVAGCNGAIHAMDEHAKVAQNAPMSEDAFAVR